MNLTVSFFLPQPLALSPPARLPFFRLHPRHAPVQETDRFGTSGPCTPIALLFRCPLGSPVTVIPLRGRTNRSSQAYGQPAHNPLCPVAPSQAADATAEAVSRIRPLGTAEHSLYPRAGPEADRLDAARPFSARVAPRPLYRAATGDDTACSHAGTTLPPNRAERPGASALHKKQRGHTPDRAPRCTVSERPLRTATSAGRPSRRDPHVSGPPHATPSDGLDRKRSGHRSPVFFAM